MELIHAVFDPLALFTLLLASWLLFNIGSEGFRAGKFAFPLLLLLVLLLLSAPAVVNPILRVYEDKAVEFRCRDTEVLPIVLLGGGVDRRATSAEDLQFMDPPTFARTLKAYQMAETYPQAKLILSGGGYYSVAESEMMAELLGILGVDSKRMQQDPRSENTFENAREVKRILEETGEGDTVYLVTSAVHMFRAKATFESMGMHVCPVPTAYLGQEDIPAFALLPQSSALQKSSALLHELIGWGYYRATGRL